tara:strand:- start:61081 stop:61335 length:255 start_codon:yes stop_codon:yes gene_type:complete
MKWYSGTIEHKGHDVLIEGTFTDSVVRITANGYQLYEKAINFWAYQEVNASDIFDKYQGMVRKCEKKVALLVDSGIIASEERDV